MMEKHKIDLHKDEGLWFLDIDFLLENKISVSYFVQKPGEMVNIFRINSKLSILGIIGTRLFSLGKIKRSDFEFSLEFLHQRSRTSIFKEILKTINFNSLRDHSKDMK